MSRKLADMSTVEQAQYRNWKSILENPIATEEEKKNARVQLDALEWKGQTGPLMAKITKLTERLDNVEQLGQSMNDDDRKALVELRKLAKRIDGETIAALERKVGKCLEGLAELTLTESQHHDDNQGGWSKHEAALVEARKGRDELSKGMKDIIARYDEKFRDVEKQIGDLRRDLNTLIADAVDEARTAIMAEAQAAAIEAIGNLLGDGDKSS